MWKQIKGYENYEISKDGKVRNKKYNRMLKNNIDTKGYYRVNLCKLENGKTKVKQHRVHRLVAEAFIKNINNEPIINHIDGDKLNNKVSNLEWCNYSYNCKHAHQIGIKKAKISCGEDSGTSKLTWEQVLMIRENKENLSDAEWGRRLGFDRTTINKVKLRKHWKYKNREEYYKEVKGK